MGQMLCLPHYHYHTCRLCTMFKLDFLIPISFTYYFYARENMHSHLHLKLKKLSDYFKLLQDVKDFKAQDSLVVFKSFKLKGTERVTQTKMVLWKNPWTTVKGRTLTAALQSATLTTIPCRRNTLTMFVIHFSVPVHTETHWRTLTNSVVHWSPTNYSYTTHMLKLPMRMLLFSHFNQQMYSESSHRRSSTSNASTLSNTHVHRHKHICMLTHKHTHSHSPAYSLLKLITVGCDSVWGGHGWMALFSVAVTLEIDSGTVRPHQKFQRNYFHSMCPPCFVN